MEELIVSLKNEVETLPDGKKPLLGIPEKTLRLAGKGSLDVQDFMVEECSIVVLPRSQAATVA